MSKPIDYTKWDNLNVSSSDEEDMVDEEDMGYEEGDDQRSKLSDVEDMGDDTNSNVIKAEVKCEDGIHLTQFKQGQSITFGNGKRPFANPSQTAPLKPSKSYVEGEQHPPHSSPPPLNKPTYLLPSRTTQSSSPHAVAAPSHINSSPPHSVSLKRPPSPHRYPTPHQSHPTSNPPVVSWVNGGVTPRYVWSQSRYDITINYLIPRHLKEVKGSEFKVSVTDEVRLRVSVVPKKDKGRDTSDVSKASEVSDSSNVKEVTMLEGDFPYRVIAFRDEDEAHHMRDEMKDKQCPLVEEINDYEIVTLRIPVSDDNDGGVSGVSEVRQPCAPDESESDNEEARSEERRCLVFTLRKDYKVGDAYLWWNCLLKGDKTVDVSQLERGDVEKRATEFKHVWGEAHKQFTERMKKQREEDKVDIGE
eukprot:GHVN01058025.1.p1 GENE.GHVN01058025.1~~GHVN01058025.1.p1  ORF type:complete len:417 (+),score=156.68 GHVN01058025.1:287-1537(+)